MKLYRCSAAIEGRCPYWRECFHGDIFGHVWSEFCYSELCDRLKVQRPSDGRWIRQRVQCEEVDVE